MDEPVDAPKMTFMTDRNNYYHEVMPFGATYHRLTNMVFSSQLERNVEVYMDGVLVKTQEEGRHMDDLK